MIKKTHIKYILILILLILPIQNNINQINKNIKIKEYIIKSNNQLDFNIHNKTTTFNNLKQIQQKSKIVDIISSKKYILIKTENNKILFINKTKSSNPQKLDVQGLITSNIKLNNDNIIVNVNDHKIISINLKENKKLWETITNPALFNITSYSLLLASNDKIYQIVPNKRIVILKKDTGEILLLKNINISNTPLKTTKKNKIIKSYKIYKNKIYILYKDGTFIVIDGTTGKTIWQKTKNNYKNFILNKHTITIIKNNGHITNISKTGKKNWTNISLKNQKNKIYKIKHKTLIKEHKNILHLINPKTGYIYKSYKIKSRYNKITQYKNAILIIKNKKKIFSIK